MYKYFSVLMLVFVMFAGVRSDLFAQTSEDTTVPVITVTSEPNGKDMTVSFDSSEEGDVVFGGACSVLSAYAKVGNNKVDLYSLRAGEYADCTILVVDSMGNESNKVSLKSFERKAFESVNPLASLLGANTAGLLDDDSKDSENNSKDDRKGEVLGQEKFMFTMSLKFGSHSDKSKIDEIKELQKFLNMKNFGTLTVDGKFGPLTKASLIKFQLANGLAGDGSVGPLTRAVLNK